MARSARIEVIAVGAPKSPLAEVISDYEGRVAKLTSFRARTVARAPTRDGAATAMRAEAGRLRALLPDRCHVIALAPGGTPPADSVAFGAMLQRLLESGRTATFLVGGPQGLDPGLIGEADQRLSLGPLTLPHQLARAVLAEQIYRALASAAGHPYAR